MTNQVIPEAAVEAAHRAICEDDLDDCLEWRGRCVKAVEASAPHILAPALSLADTLPGASGRMSGNKLGSTRGTEGGA